MEVSTRKTDPVQELVKGTFNVRVRIGEITCVMGGKTSRILRGLTSMFSYRLRQ
jgi:hypothetical protein